MYSNEHKIFLKKEKRKKRLILFFQLLIILLFIILWQKLTDMGIVNSFIFSSPKKVIMTIGDLYINNNLLKHIWITVYETIISFGLGTILGIVIASILWWNDYISKIMDPYLTVLNGLPKVALGPIIIIWFGAGIKSIIVMALLISLIITIINVYQGFIKIDTNNINLMKSLGANKKQIFFKLILPGNLNTIISALKVNISMSLIGVIMGEFLVSKEGIGYIIMYGSQIFNLNLVITGTIILCVVATIMYCLITFIEKRLVKN
ncbi:MAG: ABC transporter permease [Bacilli bacterium]